MYIDDDDVQVATCVIDLITSSLCFSRSSNVDKPQLLYKKPDSNLLNSLLITQNAVTGLITTKTCKRRAWSCDT